MDPEDLSSDLEHVLLTEEQIHTRLLELAAQIDEDYEGFGLTGELAAVVAEAGIAARFARVATRTTIPYARSLEDQALPSAERIRAAAAGLTR